MLASIWPEATRSLNPKSLKALKSLKNPRNPKNTKNPKSPTIEPTPLFLTVPGGLRSHAKAGGGPRGAKGAPKHSAPGLFCLVFTEVFGLKLLCSSAPFSFFVCFVWVLGFFLASSWMFFSAWGVLAGIVGSAKALQLDLRLSHRPFVAVNAASEVAPSMSAR